MGTTTISWLILHEAHWIPKLLEGCCEQSQLGSDPQETSAEDGQREQNVPRLSSPPTPLPCHILTAEGWTGKAVTVPCPGGILSKEAPLILPTMGAGLPAPCTVGRVCKIWRLGSSQHTDVWIVNYNL